MERETRIAVFKRDQICRACKRRPIHHIHHIVSRGAGGADTPDNLIGLCWVCHNLVHTGQIKRQELIDDLSTRQSNMGNGIQTGDGGDSGMGSMVLRRLRAAKAVRL